MSFLNKFQALHPISRYLAIGLPVGLISATSTAKLQPKGRNGLHKAKNVIIIGGIGCVGWPIAIPVLAFISYKNESKKTQSD